MFVYELFEDSNKTAVLSYGRCNPPSIGHAKLIDKILSIPGDHVIVISHTQDNKKNPLTVEEKIQYLQKMYPGKNVFFPASKECPTIVTAASRLYENGYTDLIIVVGADRVEAFTQLFNQYNGVFNDKGQGYEFKSIKVISAGERDPDADGVEGMSASKMREAAITNNVEAFKSGLAPALQPYAEKMMQQISSRLSISKKKIKESFALEFETVDLRTMSEVTNHLHNQRKQFFENKLLDVRRRPAGKTSGLRHLHENADYDSVVQYVNTLKRYGLSDRQKLSVGSKVSVMYLDLNFGFNEIEISGSSNLKEVAEIVTTNDKKIKIIKFTDGDYYPRGPIATFNGKPIDYAIFFKSSEDYNNAIMIAPVAVPDKWQLYINNTAQVSEGEVIPFAKKEPKRVEPTQCKKCGGKLEGGMHDGKRIKICVPCLTMYEL